MLAEIVFWSTFVCLSCRGVAQKVMGGFSGNVDVDRLRTREVLVEFFNVIQNSWSSVTLTYDCWALHWIWLLCTSAAVLVQLSRYSSDYFIYVQLLFVGNSAVLISLWCSGVMHSAKCHLVMATLCNRAGHYVFCPVVSSFSIFFFSSPNLSRHRLDVCHTCTHDVALVRI